MKKILMLSAIASVALVSCVNDDSAFVGEGVKVTFDSPLLYSNVNSKANVFGEIGNHQYSQGGTIYSYPREESFVIYAVSHDGNFDGWASAAAAAFNNTAISWDNSVDGWAPKTSTGGYYYWEQGKKMSFAACSPAELDQPNWGGADNRTYGPEGLTITDFEVAADATKQYDLLFSTRSVNQTAANMAQGAANYSGIPIKFQHALSSIRFSIANSSPETVVLTGITLNGVKYKGTFAENITEDENDKSLYDVTPTTGNVQPAWTVDPALIANPYVAFTGNIQFLENPRYVSDLVGEVGTSTDIVHQLLLMPQELTNAASVTVEYTVNGSPNSKTVQIAGLETVNPANGEGQGTVVTEWEMGKRYTYRLYYSSETADKDKIYFAPSTDGWKDVDVIVVPL